MGGTGSGNLWRYGTRGVCEHNKRIDIRWLRKMGFLREGAARRLSWSIGDEPAGFITYRVHGDVMELDYKFRECENDWEDVNERVPLVRVNQHFGGTRTYFRCLSCQRDCMVLYGGSHFRCRKCYNLAYASQNEDATDRMRRKAEKIRAKVGGSTDLDWPFPDKPKGMHWQTYERLRCEGERIEELYDAQMMHRVMLIAGTW